MSIPYRFIFFCFIIGLSSDLVRSQNAINGQVKGQNESISYANVLLFNAIDSVLVKGTISNEDGFYELSSIKDGNYYLMASMMGYDDIHSDSFVLDGGQNLQIPVMTFAESLVLDEVVVNADKPLYEQKVDRMVINVQNSIVAAGSTALEVLERSPGVTINRQNNSISLIGKSGVTIMINGKISYLPTESIVQLLEGMSSENIESIELITTPPANLDAEGNAGFINIVLKERTDVGLNGSYSLSGGVGNGATTNNSINFNYRKNKVNLFECYSFLYRTQDQFFTFERTYLDENQDEVYVNSESDRDPIQRNHNLRIGLDYQLTEKTVMGVILSGYDNKWTMDAVTNSDEFLNDEVSGFVTVYSVERNQWKNFSTNFNIRHDFKEGGFVSADYDYLKYDNENPTDYVNEYYDENGEFLEEELLRSGKKTPIDIHVVAADYSNQKTDKLKLEFGVKGAFSTFENDVVVEYLEDGEFVEDSTLTNVSNLDERILAAYSSADYKLSEKLDGKFGLRYEHTESKMVTDKEGVVVDRSFGEWFPSVFLTHTLNDSLSLNYSYSRRITRPTFNQMAPFVIFFDPNTFFAGNPAIQPAISNSIKAGINYKSYVLSLQYTLEKGTISRFEPRFDEENERLVFVADNIDHVNTFSATFGVPFRISNWWRTQNTLIVLHTDVKNDSETSQFEFDLLSFNINSTNSFKISESVSAELVFFYISDQVWGSNRVSPTYFMNLGVQKKFSEKWGTLRFNVNDALESFKFNVKATTGDGNVATENTLDFSNRTFLLTYTRSFGNKKLKSARARKGAAEDERRRVN